MERAAVSCWPSYLALGAMPPFGIFRSEFEINVEGGFASASTVTAAILIIPGCDFDAFFGLAATTTQILLVRGHRQSTARPPCPPRHWPRCAVMAGGATPSPQADSAASPRAPESAPEAAAARCRRGEPSAWMVVPVCWPGPWCCWSWAMHPPADLTSLLARKSRPRAGRSALMTTGTGTVAGSVSARWDELTRRVAAGSRFADLFGTAQPDGLLLTAHLAR